MKRIVESMRVTRSACAALLLLAINPIAQARQPSPEKQLVGSVRVAYADLDLSHDADVRLLLGRIEKAAYRACGGNPRRHPGYSVMPNRTEAVFKECREDAIARAVAVIDAPILSQARLQAANE